MFLISDWFAQVCNCLGRNDGLIDLVNKV